MGRGDHAMPPLHRPQTPRRVRLFLARRGSLAATTLGRSPRGFPGRVAMRFSDRPHPSQAWRPLSAKTKVPQGAEAIQKGPPSADGGRYEQHDRASENLHEKAFTGMTVVLTLDTRLVKNEKIPWRIIEKDAILIDLEEGEVIRLNPVAAEIWNAIDGTRTMDDIVAHICRTFEVSERKARRGVHRFAKQLLRQGLIQEGPLS